MVKRNQKFGYPKSGVRVFTVASRVGVVAVLLAVLLAGLSACSAETSGAETGDSPLHVYATTGYLADLARNVAPEAEVTTMVGPGGDPHVHQPSTRDIQRMQDADLVLWNGLHLEAQMLDQLESFGDRQLAVAEQLPAEELLAWPETDAEGNALRDPHVWNSPGLWALAVAEVAEKLAELDPERAESYRANAEQYVAQIEDAAQEAERLLAGIPDDGRTLVTGHDAFAYFGHTFDLEVYATDVISTDAQLSAVEISGLADLIAGREVPVIFQDNQASPQAIVSLQEAVRARGWQVEIAEAELYADSLGSEPGVDTYLGVFRHNAGVVAEALGGSEDESR